MTDVLLVTVSDEGRFYCIEWVFHILSIYIQCIEFMCGMLYSTLRVCVCCIPYIECVVFYSSYMCLYSMLIHIIN